MEAVILGWCAGVAFAALTWLGQPVRGGTSPCLNVVLNLVLSFNVGVTVWAETWFLLAFTVA